jgi:hypothetical protein
VNAQICSVTIVVGHGRLFFCGVEEAVEKAHGSTIHNIKHDCVIIKRTCVVYKI